MSISITKEKLEKMYREKANDEVCSYLKVTKPTLISLLKKNGISLKGKGNRNSYPKVKVI